MNAFLKSHLESILSNPGITQINNLSLFWHFTTDFACTVFFRSYFFICTNQWVTRSSWPPPSLSHWFTAAYLLTICIPSFPWFKDVGSRVLGQARAFLQIRQALRREWVIGGRCKDLHWFLYFDMMGKILTFHKTNLFDYDFGDDRHCRTCKLFMQTFKTILLHNVPTAITRRSRVDPRPNNIGTI